MHVTKLFCGVGLKGLPGKIGMIYEVER
jgi:hypothetical protein